MRQGRLDHLLGMIYLLTRPVAEGRAEPVRHGRRMIDDYRLWGSRTWRHMAFHPFDEGEEIWHGSSPATRNASLSEGRALAVVVGDVHETPHRTRDNTDFPPPLRTRKARLRLACPALARRNGAPHGRNAGGESDPPDFAAGAPRGRARVEARVETRTAPLCPSCGEVALTTVIPGGKAIGRPVALTVDECCCV